MNKELVLRLAKYRRLLYKLKNLGLERVFSNNLGDAIGVTPALVRKDFSMISLTGNKRGGYNIDSVILSLDEILGQTQEKEVVLVGCGRIGSALLEYKEFRKDGLEIAAAFDSDPAKVDRDGRVPVLPMEELASFVSANAIEIGIVAVPESSAMQVFEQMVQAGILGFLNFTPVELKCSGRCNYEECPQQCTVQNVNIGLELESLFYLVNLKRRRPPR